MRKNIKNESIVAQQTRKKLHKDKSFWTKVLNGYCCYPQIVELNFGTSCNQDCIYCYNKNHKYYREPLSITLRKHEIDILINCIIFMNVKYVICSGGLEFYTSRHSYYTIDKIIDNKLKLIVFTNGSLIEEKHIKQLVRCHFVRFSVDSFSLNTYKRIRGSHANFYKVMQNIEKLIKIKQEKMSKTKIGISAIINKYNIHELDDLIVKANHLGINVVDIKADYANAKNIKSDNLLQEKVIRELKKKYRNEYNGTEIIFTDEMLLGKKSQLSFGEKCWSAHEKIIVDPFGNTYPCSLWSQPKYIRNKRIMGNIREFDGSLSKLWKNTFEFRKKISPINDCSFCTYWDAVLNNVIDREFCNKTN